MSNQDHPDKKAANETYVLLLEPHRSLSKRGFLILMLCLCGVSFAAGLIFLLQGAWPVFGFFGLDVLLVYLAFKANFKSGGQRELIEIENGHVTVRTFQPSGKESIDQFDAYWCRFMLESEKLLIKCRSETLEIGKFLIPDERAEVVNELDTALYRYLNRQFS